MAARSPLFNILGEDFLTLVAKHIGDDWRTFFIDLGFETFDLPHFSHKVDSLLETILNGLHSWKKKPLTDKSSKSTSIKEIFDLIIEGLELNGCRTIAEKIQSNFTSSDISNENRAKASNQVNLVVSVTEHKIISKKRVIEETLDVQDSGCKSKKSKYGDDIDESNDNRVKQRVFSVLTSPTENKVNSKRWADDKLYVEDSPIDSKKSKHDDRETVEQTPNSCIVLRKYQEELAEKALQGKNTIICVVTNAGKTIVAFHIIDEHIRRNPKAKVVFMARTNPLLDQQYKKACKYLKHLQESNDIKIFLVGQESTDESARLQFDNGRLFFMTPQLLMNKMKLKEKLALPINKFSMLVLDECHHVHGKTPYNDIMATYRKAKYDEQGLKLPQIVGLTASPGTNKATDESSAQKHLINIMINMDVIHLSTVRTHTANLLEHISEVKQVKLQTEVRKRNPVQDKLKSSISDVEGKFRSEKVQQFLDTYMQDAKQNLQNPPNEKLEQTYIQWITETRLKVENVLNKDAYVPRLMLTYLRHLDIYAECLEMNSLLDTYEVVDLINTKMSQDSIQSKNANTLEEKQISKYLNEVCIFMKSLETQQVDENPNVTTIINILEEEYKKEGDSSRFLIFVRTRVTAKALAKRLQHLKHLNCQYFTGSQVGLEDGGLTKHKQLEVIDNFKSGVHKCIVATAVASEGIDIPECTMIIRYRFTANEITSYQMKGIK
ncbi:Hypothetical predicted protein [Mytilus galloprovincialis]|uniref:Uncharacterized protein n=1 Tax=Mytilus galloprovincialis TaxID=29158 RepID=A0A8B6HPM2_MYTGA|nr:Hypothetical predicted protein [Mytilus galloprovincialis]